MQAEEAPSKRRPAASAKRPSGAGAAKKQPAGGGRKTETPESSRDNISRQRVIEAAVQCILDQGFYRASSNAIAERAGVSWGVIQYYFGSREALMLAVLEEGTRQLSEIVRTAEITGATVTERIAQYMDILASYYGSPEYLAYSQVLINLAPDPRTSEQTRETMARIDKSASPELDRLLRKVLAGTGIRRPAVRSLLFHALRGLVLSHVMLETLPDRKDESRQFPQQRRLLAEALGLLIEAQSRPGA
jgi:TetR/AcrR family transcriptional regulator, regulator of cefoperazone and chloramphenicol sensitivity